MTTRTRRKCRHCGQLFRPDPRNLRHQRYCSAKECRRASKAASQRRWLAKTENRDYFRGPEQMARVRYHNNDYSVPVAYGYRQVWVRGYVDRVVIGCAAEVIARHPRSYEGEDMVFDPLHYLPLIERKVGALDQAAPLAGWELPDAFATLRRLMEARSGRAGRREYV